MPIVSDWTLNPSDARVPSEKLTKNTLDTKSDIGHTHDDRYYTETEVDTALLIKQDLLVSGVNIKTINYESIIGSGNINIQGGGGGSGGSYLNDFYGDATNNELVIDYTNTTGSDVVTSWETTPSDLKVPSEKLVKDTFDGIIDIVYPIGSIYMSVNSTSPATLFGGTWEQIEDTFLLASGTTYCNGDTGGSADATLVLHNHSTNDTGEYFVTSENTGANNTRVTYSSSGNRYVDGMTDNTTPFHHREYVSTEGTDGTGKNMPPYLAVNVWKRTA